MIAYPNLLEAIADRAVDDLAAESGVDADTIRAILLGWVAPLEQRPALAAALGIDEAILFRPVSRQPDVDLEPALPAGEARYVTDPATLRTIDRPRPTT